MAPFEVKVLKSGVHCVVSTTGAKRPATPEEIELWNIISTGCPKEEVSDESVLAWYLFYRLGDVSISEVEPKWLASIMRDFAKMGIAKTVQLIRDEFPNDFRYAQNNRCRPVKEQASPDDAGLMRKRKLVLFY